MNILYLTISFNLQNDIGCSWFEAELIWQLLDIARRVRGYYIMLSLTNDRCD